MNQQLEKLSRLLSYALRHRPSEYDLILDEQGWVMTDELLRAINKKHPDLGMIEYNTLLELLQHSDKERFEISKGSIRARYGHSLREQRITYPPAIPPDYLYHGTTKVAADSIFSTGLHPNQRHYVHMSIDIPTAIHVGKRRTSSPIIIIIHALKAYEEGLMFYRGNDSIWLADTIPSKFLTRHECIITPH